MMFKKFIVISLYAIIWTLLLLGPAMAVRWDFTSSVEGWTGRNATVRYSPDGNGRLYMDTIGDDPGMVRSSLSISASSNNLIRMYMIKYRALQKLKRL